jgi:hypothetical protein
MNERPFRRTALAFGIAGLTIAATAGWLAACSPSSSGTGQTGQDAAADATQAADALSSDSSPDAATEAAPGDSSIVDEAAAEASISADAGDASAADADASTCPGVTCNGACLGAGDCSSCDGSPLLCGTACVSSCNGCVGGTQDASLPIECFACDSNQANPIGSCVANDQTAYCLSGNYAGAYLDGGPGFHCPCGDGGASDCPGDTQVCAPTPNGPTICVTCGEVYVFDLTDAGCKNGSACSPSTATCN